MNVSPSVSQSVIQLEMKEFRWHKKSSMEYKKKEKKQKMRNKKMGIEESADLITGVLPD